MMLFKWYRRLRKPTRWHRWWSRQRLPLHSKRTFGHIRGTAVQRVGRKSQERNSSVRENSRNSYTSMLVMLDTAYYPCKDSKLPNGFSFAIAYSSRPRACCGNTREHEPFCLCRRHHCMLFLRGNLTVATDLNSKISGRKAAAAK